MQSADNENYLVANANGSLNLYYDNEEKLATTSTGIDVTGVITTDGLTTSANINFGDGDKAVFGAGNDLQIWHGGIDSYIVNETGNLDIINKANDKDISFYSDDGSGGFTEYFTVDGANARNRFHRNVLFGDGS